MYDLYSSWIPFFFFSSSRRHTRLQGDWSSDVCSSDLAFAGRKKSQIFAGDNFKGRKSVMDLGEVDALGCRFRHLIGAPRGDLRRGERRKDVAILKTDRTSSLTDSG